VVWFWREFNQGKYCSRRGVADSTWFVEEKRIPDRRGAVSKIAKPRTTGRICRGKGRPLNQRERRIHESLSTKKEGEEFGSGNRSASDAVFQGSTEYFCLGRKDSWRGGEKKRSFIHTREAANERAKNPLGRRGEERRKSRKKLVQACLAGARDERKEWGRLHTRPGRLIEGEARESANASFMKGTFFGKKNRRILEPR